MHKFRIIIIIRQQVDFDYIKHIDTRNRIEAHSILQQLIDKKVLIKSKQVYSS